MKMASLSMKSITKNTIKKRTKRQQRVDKNGLTARQRWMSRWLERNLNFGP